MLIGIWKYAKNAPEKTKSRSARLWLEIELNGLLPEKYEVEGASRPLNLADVRHHCLRFIASETKRGFAGFYRRSMHGLSGTFCNTGHNSSLCVRNHWLIPPPKGRTARSASPSLPLLKNFMKSSDCLALIL